MNKRRNLFAELEFLGFDPLCIREALRTCNDFDSALNMLNSNKVVKIESELYSKGLPKSVAKYLAGSCQSAEEALKKYHDYTPVGQQIRKKCVEMGYSELLAEKAIDMMMDLDHAIQYIVTTDPSTLSRTFSSQRFNNPMQPRAQEHQMPFIHPAPSHPMVNPMPYPQNPTVPMQYNQPYPYAPPPASQYSHPLSSSPSMPYSVNQFPQHIMQGPHPMYNPQLSNPYNPPNAPQYFPSAQHPLDNRLPVPPNPLYIPPPSYIPHPYPGSMQSPPLRPPPSIPNPQNVPYNVNRASVSIRFDNNNPNDELSLHRDDLGRNFEEAFDNLTINRTQRTLDMRRMSMPRPEEEVKEDNLRENQLVFIRIEDFFENMLGRYLLLDMLSRLYEPEGLDSEFIQNLPRQPYSRGLNLNSETCVICYEDYEEGVEIIILKCRHPFHTECISKWLESSTKCPLCKDDMGEEQ
ncbi:hypothetical protein SteCoe_11678 [Stentor coeruleus]|uniref:RING-type domain-containing protein n=1 Tax=Stentor coeruleus TaxID=5963 RepID=A0A1R2CCP1_9CILI|nr:hypothetical protein SteCoe_11678 [Stentor coeruleus]